MSHQATLLFMSLAVFIVQHSDARQNEPDSVLSYKLLVNQSGSTTTANIENIVNAGTMIGAHYLKVHQLDSAQRYLMISDSLVKSFYSSPNLYQANNDFFLGEYYLETFQDTLSTERYRKCHTTRTHLLGPLHPETTKALIGMAKGDMFINTRYDKALKVLGDALDNLTKATKVDSSYFSYLYYYLSVAHSDNGDYNEAFWYGHAALDIAHAEDLDDAFLAKCHNSLAIAYYRDLQKHLSIEHFLKAIEYRRKFDGQSNKRTALYYTNISTCHRELGNLELAQHYNQLAYDIYLTQADAAFGLSNCHFNSGVHYLLRSEKDSAIGHFKKSLVYREKSLSKNPNQVAKTLVNIGKAYKEKEEVDSALYYFQNGLKNISPDSLGPDLIANPSHIPVEYAIAAHEILVHKGATFYQKYKTGNNNQEDLQAALDCFLMADSLMTKVWENHDDIPSKLHLSNHLHDAQELTLEILFEIHRLQVDAQYDTTALGVMEGNRHRMLMENLTYTHAARISGVSDSLLNAEKEAHLMMQKARHLFKSERYSIKPDPVKLQSLHNKVVNTTRKLITLKNEVRNQAPAKSNITETQGLLASMRANPNTLYIQYFWGINGLYICAFSKGDIYFSKVTETAALEQSVVKFNKLLYDGINLPTIEQDYQAFTETGYHLYGQLVEPVLRYFENNFKSTSQKMVIIPDGPLALLSFGALPTLLSPEATADYRSIPYLIKAYAVNYSYSLDFLLNHTTTRKTSNRLLGFGYSASSDLSAKSTVAESRVPQLRGSKDELKAIAQIWDGDYYNGRKANLLNFKKMAAGYDILHIAVHAQSDMVNESNNLLLFPSERVDSRSQDTLFSYEVQNLDLKAQLAVLSACETGRGKLLKGEGIYSIARSFAMGGCPSLVMSLWAVNDIPTSSLMKSFYLELNEGSDIDLSLQKAQLAYITQADKISAHPANWAAFVSLGQSSGVLTPATGSAYLIVSGILILLAALFVIKKRRSA